MATRRWTWPPGPGILALATAKLGAKVVGTDFSPLMVERLQARVTKASWLPERILGTAPPMEVCWANFRRSSGGTFWTV